MLPNMTQDMHPEFVALIAATLDAVRAAAAVAPVADLWHLDDADLWHLDDACEALSEVADRVAPHLVPDMTVLESRQAEVFAFIDGIEDARLANA